MDITQEQPAGRGALDNVHEKEHRASQLSLRLLPSLILHTFPSLEAFSEPLLLGFYVGSIMEAWLIKSLATDDRTQPAAPLPS